MARKLQTWNDDRTTRLAFPDGRASRSEPGGNFFAGSRASSATRGMRRSFVCAGLFSAASLSRSSFFSDAAMLGKSSAMRCVMVALLSFTDRRGLTRAAIARHPMDWASKLSWAKARPVSDGKDRAAINDTIDLDQQCGLRGAHS